MNGITINKVKWDGKKVEIHSTESKRGVDTDKTTRSIQWPTPEFCKVFVDAQRHALEILELDNKDYANFGSFVVTGFSINTEEADGRSGIVLTCQKKLEQTNAPAVFNTPHLREPVKSEERGLAGFYGDALGRLIERARVVAVKYLDGERGQRDLFDANKKVDAAKDPAKVDQLTLVDGGGKKTPSKKKR